MAKFTFILTMLLITFSFTTISSAEPQNNVIDLDKKTLLLPSDNPNPKETSTAVGFSEILPEKVETKTDDDVSEMPLDRPMKIIRFHPINRHFPHHRCRHGEKPIRPRQVSFGDDMMVPSGENGDFDQMGHVVRQEPEEWIGIHRHHPHHRHHGMPRFPMGKHHDFFADKRFGEEKEERFGEEREERFEEAREERQDPGFMRSVRKFLNGRF